MAAAAAVAGCLVDVRGWTLADLRGALELGPDGAVRPSHRPGRCIVYAPMSIPTRSSRNSSSRPSFGPGSDRRCFYDWRYLGEGKTPDPRSSSISRRRRARAFWLRARLWVWLVTRARRVGARGLGFRAVLAPRLPTFSSRTVARTESSRAARVAGIEDLQRRVDPRAVRIRSRSTCRSRWSKTVMDSTRGSGSSPTAATCCSAGSTRSAARCSTSRSLRRSSAAAPNRLPEPPREAIHDCGTGRRRHRA